jgi:hypothetical protein
MELDNHLVTGQSRGPTPGWGTRVSDRSPVLSAGGVSVGISSGESHTTGYG